MTPARRSASAALLAASLALAAEADAQASALIIEARGGVTVPLGSFADGTGQGEGAGPGAALTVHFALPGGGRWTPYLGFNQLRFACEDAGCSSGGRYVATGFQAGLRYAPIPDRSVIPWIAAGILTTRVETDALGGADVGVSDLGVGGEVGVGVHIGGASQVAVSPGLRLARVGTRLPGGADLTMGYLVADLGVVIAF